MDNKTLIKIAEFYIENQETLRGIAAALSALAVHRKQEKSINIINAEIIVRKNVN